MAECKNNIEIFQDFIRVELTLGEYMECDLDDMELLKKYRWFSHKNHKTFYAETRVGDIHKKFHQLKMGVVPIDMDEIDHIDRNGLNNKSENLRFVTASENQHNKGMPLSNTTGIKGVYFRERRNCYVAQLRINGLNLSASFSVNKFMMPAAFIFAIIKRREWEQEYKTEMGF